MGWLYLRAGDKILQHPELQRLSSKVVRRQVSLSMPTFLRKAPLSQCCLSPHWPELGHFVVSKPITSKEESITSLTRTNQNLLTSGTFPSHRLLCGREWILGKMGPLRKEEKDPQQCLLQREERGVWQPRLK